MGNITSDFSRTQISTDTDLKRTALCSGCGKALNLANNEEELGWWPDSELLILPQHSFLLQLLMLGLLSTQGVILPVTEPARIKLRFQHKAMATREGNVLE